MKDSLLGMIPVRGPIDRGGTKYSQRSLQEMDGRIPAALVETVTNDGMTQKNDGMIETNVVIREMNKGTHKRVEGGEG